MIFCGVMQTESIHLHEEDNLDWVFAIDLTIAKHEPKFYVYTPEIDGWFWEFWYTSRTDYERVKMCIMDVAAECESAEETLDALSEVFLEYFESILVFEEDECQCNSKLN